MPSDYEAITRQNVTELGTKTSTRKTQICMYSDLTHFVYELLQNADDYGATEILFKLTDTQVTIEHNGSPFTEENVRAITSFGESTSRDDMLKTGRFGVGFKSVFAFTATPIIISGNEHFMIHDLYRVSEYPYPSDLVHDRTRIVLPFNHDTEKPDYVEELMSAQEAYERISARLTGLNMHTLLFTRNIREIRWEIDGASGHYLREDKPSVDSRETTITDGRDLNKYLVFAQTPTWRGKSFKDVEIAFKLDEKGQIQEIEDFLHVLFCTTQETHLRFILNGPYKTNPSRETISEDDRFNRHLMEVTCELLGWILPHLRDQRLLTTQFLGILPNSSDALRPFYKPLLATVVDRFNSDKLVPTDDGRFAAAPHVFQGPAALREVITAPELAFLLQLNSACWAKGTVPNTRSDLFLKSLAIKHWGYAELQDALESRYSYLFLWLADDQALKWLEERSDEWLQRLYILLGDALSKEECKAFVLRECQIVRVTQGKTIRHVTGPEAYFPKAKSYRTLPQIKPAILRGKTPQQSDRIVQGLVALGVREIGEEERIDLILETYYGEDSSKITHQQHLDHMRLFIKWWEQERSISKFRQHLIFRVVGDGSGQQADSCYLDKPLKTTRLSIIYKELRKGLPKKHKLWGGYRELKSEGFCEFAEACGVATCLPITCCSAVNHPRVDALWEDYYRGARWMGATAINDDFIIPDLEALLNIRNLEINRLIWDVVREAEPEVLEASFRPNRGYPLRKDKSSLVLMLTEHKWIPDKKGKFHRPAQLSKEGLHTSFKFDNRNGWLDEINFGEDAKRASEEHKRRASLARDLGISTKIVEGLVELPEEERNEIQRQFEEQLKKYTAAKKATKQVKSYHTELSAAFKKSGRGKVDKAEPLSGSSKNPERRGRKLRGDIIDALSSEPSLDARFTFHVKKKWKSKNDIVRQKLLDWYAGQCQICHKTFQQSNGQPYFEGLYLVSRTSAEWIDRPGNVLCLCPWHSAMFQFGSKYVDIDVQEHILAFTPKAQRGIVEPTIEIILCAQKETILFHEDHFLELKIMIEESLKTES
ncbi:MAG: sacsin N-terminal ATP-binding-like domain-containing protein [Candidatus Hydrogenedentales bacterium]